MFKKLALTIGLLTSQLGAAVVTVDINPKDVLPRDGSATEVELHVVIKGITVKKETPEQHIQALRVIVPGHNANFPIPFVETGTEEDKIKVDLSLRSGGAQILEQDDGSFQVDGLIVLSGKTATALSDAISSSSDKRSLIVRLKYQGEDEHSEISLTLTSNLTIPKEAPLFTELGGGHQKVIATWAPKSEILFSDNKKKAPNAVSMFVLEADQGTKTLPARVFDGADDRQEVACVVNTNMGDGQNCITCDGEQSDNVYINTQKLDPDVKSRSFPASTGSGSVSDLKVTNDRGEKISYIAFLIYAPEGAARSICRRSEVYETLTFMEYLADGATTSKGDPTCFIASAAYGSPDHPNVKMFRWFRDTYLMNHFLGRAFVTIYYWLGPYAAKVVEETPLLKDSARAGLDVLADFLRAHL